MEKDYYVYAWYFISTNKIFHIGKGKGNRYLETKISRNAYFKNIIAKYKDDVAVKKLFVGLTNSEACQLERKLIAEYKAIGECETNFHEGGCGGNTGNYDNPERSKKLAAAASKRVGQLNSNYGNSWSIEQKAKQSEKLKKAWADPAKRELFLKNRHYDDFVPWNKGKTLPPSWNKGKKMSEETYIKMMVADCHYWYEVYFNDQLIYCCLGKTHLYSFCKETFNISRTIVNSIVLQNWVPKFNKHNFLKSLKIIQYDKGVTTIPDECKGVEWRLQPFEVPGNQD